MDIVLKLFTRLVLPIILPMIIIIIAGNIKYNEKIKKIIMTLLGLIYNFIIGLLGFLIRFLIAVFITSINYNIIVACVFAVLLIPLNIFIKKKAKINVVLYVIINTLIILLGYYTYFCIATKTINPYIF